MIDFLIFIYFILSIVVWIFLPHETSLIHSHNNKQIIHFSAHCPWQHGKCVTTQNEVIKVCLLPFPNLISPSILSLPLPHNVVNTKIRLLSVSMNSTMLPSYEVRCDKYSCHIYLIISYIQLTSKRLSEPCFIPINFIPFSEQISYTVNYSNIFIENLGMQFTAFKWLPFPGIPAEKKINFITTAPKLCLYFDMLIIYMCNCNRYIWIKVFEQNSTICIAIVCNCGHLRPANVSRSLDRRSLMSSDGGLCHLKFTWIPKSKV